MFDVGGGSKSEGSPFQEQKPRGWTDEAADCARLLLRYSLPGKKEPSEVGSAVCSHPLPLLLPLFLLTGCHVLLDD